jgi:serine/threonine protein kinase
MIVDNLVLEKCLGKGAFGEVYLTSKKGSDQKFATKKLDREQIEKSEAMKYLKNEIIILQNLKHPNIVKYEDVKKTKKHFYIVMEYCNGGELSQALEKYQKKFGKPFSQEIVQHLMRQIIDAFKYIHGLKIIHRDIKLDNILLNFDTEEDKENLNMMKAQCKIIDFGFACRISKSGLQYSTLGSPINMDPIILKKLNSTGRKSRQLGYDQKADIWSLGTICYEMLIGKSAFDAEDMDELVSKIEDGTYTVPTSLSREVISFLNAMLQYDSHARLNSLELSRHVFLTKDVKDFHPIDMQKASKKIKKGNVVINVKRNKSIWAIFNAEDEDKLTKIAGYQIDKPIDEREEFEHEKQQRNLSPEKKEINNNDKVEPEIRQIASFPMPNISGLSGNTSSNSSFSGPMLPNPFQGIPGNPIHQQIQGVSQEQQGQGSPFNESNYVFRGGIFESK